MACCLCLCASCIELHHGAKITQVTESGPSLLDRAGDDIAYKIYVPIVSAPPSSDFGPYRCWARFDINHLPSRQRFRRRTLGFPATAVGDAANRCTQVHAPQRIKVSYDMG
ncbi:hypothetical protein COCSADRAFT_355388 [Bipolaris sorokiniana ND90Pr]|uniref:Uncharacterized protein n=1 Tax=Cochliobolus sativus (strain ND90Pr / ATCC 201652) TaxID=665912 RepID=M2TAP3_COCSN|nr:uncharacterized protein COCSADRAFT_355388 [Bipolaris sorokiniana ND90Pr]EMD65962.1 hypothetical protein COCSADRAFT_355388 [Bipolaris sorokiniana ND90Pr]